MSYFVTIVMFNSSESLGSDAAPLSLPFLSTLWPAQTRRPAPTPRRDPVPLAGDGSVPLSGSQGLSRLLSRAMSLLASPPCRGSPCRNNSTQEVSASCCSALAASYCSTGKEEEGAGTGMGCADTRGGCMAREGLSVTPRETDSREVQVYFFAAFTSHWPLHS